MRGVLLEELTWPQAERLLAEDLVVVLPVGAATKEHGPHLPLGTDYFTAEALRTVLVEEVRCIALPTVSYGYYPAFRDWPGSVSVAPAVFAAYVSDIIKSLAGQGWRRFLVLNTGVSTSGPLDHACREIAADTSLRIAMTRGLGERAWQEVREEKAGTHGGEHETSIMLAVRPDLVAMELAPDEVMAKPDGFQTGGGQPPLASLFGPMTGLPGTAPEFFTASGIHGNATLATPEKAEIAWRAMCQDLVAVVKALAALPIG
jgi:creatinine amidohydrolase